MKLYLKVNGNKEDAKVRYNGSDKQPALLGILGLKEMEVSKSGSNGVSY